MTPKILFIYSKVYDGFLKAKYGKKEKFKLPSEKTRKKILNYIKKVEKTWRKDEKRILAEISRITKLSWKNRVIYCYVVGKLNFTLSDPLTLPIQNKVNRFIDLLIHELIHNIFASRENFRRAKKAWNYIYKKYKKESENVKIHIVIYAIYAYIYLKFFDEKRLKKDIQWASKYKDYKRAWEIVLKERYQNIIKEFRKRIR